MPNSQASTQQLMMQVAQALQQGADPQSVAQQLMQMGLSQDQAVSLIQQVGQSMQQQEPSASYKKGGSTYSGGVWFAQGGMTPSNYADPYSTMMAIGGMIPRAQMGMEVPPRPEAQDFPDYGSFKAADDAWLSQYGSDAMPSFTDEDLAQYNEVTPEQIASYNNPALAAVTGQPTTTMASNVVSTPISTPSVVDFIQAIGGKSDFKTRAALAKSIGITNYKGRADQNNELLNHLRAHADMISRNPQAYNVPPVVAQHVQNVVRATTPRTTAPVATKTPVASSDSIPKVSLTQDGTMPDTTNVRPDLMQNILNNIDSAGLVGRAKMKTAGKDIQSGAPMSFYGKAAALGLSPFAANYLLKKELTKGLSSLPPVSKVGASNILENKGAGKRIEASAKSFEKLPKKIQKAIASDEAAKLAISEAKAEETLMNAHNVSQALKEAEAEKIAQAAAGIKGSGKAAPSMLDLIMANAKYVKSGLEGIKGAGSKALGKSGEALKWLGETAKGLRFEEGGYVPNYSMAYGGYVPPQAMYGMGMAQGGQMPQWLAERRFAAAGNQDKMSQYGYDNGGIVTGQEMYASPEDLQRLRDGGYQFEILQ